MLIDLSFSEKIDNDKSYFNGKFGNNLYTSPQLGEYH